MRNKVIDELRGICMIAMILIHTSYFFISNPIAYTVWNYAQFAVPGFVFCSAYLFFSKYKSSHNLSFIPFATKRISRLILPYYIFLPFYFALLYFFDKSKLSTVYILKSLTLTGGIDINWLILLFIYFILIQYLLVKITNNKILFFGFLVLSFLSLFFFQFGKIQIDYRYSMWLPWTFLLFYLYYFVRFETKKWFMVGTFFIFSFLFCAFFIINTSLNHPTSLIQNKYPPNIFYMSFGIVGILILFFLSKKSLFKPISLILSFFSKYSYEIYFIHYLILTFFTYFLKVIPFTWYTFFLSVTISSLIAMYFFNKGRAVFFKK